MAARGTRDETGYVSVMSDRMTNVHLPGIRASIYNGLAEHGRQEPADMIRRMREDAAQMRDAAEMILNARDEDFAVDTYRGVHVARNHEGLWPPREVTAR